MYQNQMAFEEASERDRQTASQRNTFRCKAKVAAYRVLKTLDQTKERKEDMLN
jgi:hypothetical protein